ncbi:MAG: response regulator transcription factor [Gemmatimonadota bacterium]
MTEPNVIRVLLADDHAFMREGIRSVLAGEAGFEVVAEASNGEEAVRLAEREKPDVVVLDISMPGANGLVTTATLRDRLPGTRILILSVHDHPEYVLESVRAGAHGYLRKDAAPTELREAIRTVFRGDSFFGPGVATQLSAALQEESARKERTGRLELLTGRERDVLGGIAAGGTNKEIAARLGLSPRTVESYRESLMRKLEIRTVAGLTLFAVEAGIVLPPS